MPELEKALDDARPAIAAALADAERELDELASRKRELEDLIARAKTVLGAPATPDPEARLTLHKALEQILRENGNEWMTVKDLARVVNDRELYRKQDGSRVEPNQIHARTKNYSSLFEKDGPRVRLRDPGLQPPS